jgi:hypothetical protein
MISWGRQPVFKRSEVEFAVRRILLRLEVSPDVVEGD